MELNVSQGIYFYGFQWMSCISGSRGPQPVAACGGGVLHLKITCRFHSAVLQAWRLMGLEAWGLGLDCSDCKMGDCQIGGVGVMGGCSRTLDAQRGQRISKSTCLEFIISDVNVYSTLCKVVSGLECSCIFSRRTHPCSVGTYPLWSWCVCSSMLGSQESQCCDVEFLLMSLATVG